MQIPIYQIDAFADAVFRGNPAAVCPLTEWLPDRALQQIAAENNLSETAFFVPDGEDFELRWFTPRQEVELCGHATLAAGWVVFHREPRRSQVRFHTLSGALGVSRRDDLLVLDFPSSPPDLCTVPQELIEALGKVEPCEILRDRRYYLVQLASETEVRRLAPDMRLLAGLDRLGVTVTAEGSGVDDVDFVSRFFAPAAGVPEDPVTGSAHCALVPFWAPRLGKFKLHARQLSERGGELFCEMRGSRVDIAGRAVPYLEGTIRI